MSKYKKGQSGNINGRPKGAMNKEKKALRECITAFLEDNYELLEKDLLELQGKDRIDRMIALLEYSTPKLNRTDLSNDGKEFNFTVLSDAELINQLKQLAESIGKSKIDSK